jgi:hypothetical protein
MKCDDFLPSLETGGFWRRWRVRRHAVRCPRCAAIRTSFGKAMAGWAAAEPLAPRARKLWKLAAEENVHRPAPRHIPRRAAVAFGTVAGVLLLFAVAMMQKHVVSPQPKTEVVRDVVRQSGESRELGPITVEEIDPAQGLSRLAADVEQLDADMRAIRRKAERLDTQQQIAVTLERFGSR